MYPGRSNIQVGCQAAFAGKPAPTFRSRGYREIVVGCQAAFASKPAPTFGSRGYSEIVVGCQAAFAGKPAATFGSWGHSEIVVGCQAAFASKPAPTFGSRGYSEIVVGCRAAFAGKPAPTFGSRGYSEIVVGCQAAFAGKPAPTFGSWGRSEIVVGCQAAIHYNALHSTPGGFMDIELARTFLEITRCGSLAAAAEKLHVTQTAITARVKSLESQLGSTLFVRNRAGARLTADGEAFVVYANQLLQTWEAAKRDLPLPDGYRNVLHIGGEVSLCNPLMLGWAQALRQHLPGHALRTEVREGEYLLRQLELGVLDAALVFQPQYWPGLQVEQVLEEKLILVQLVSNPAPYVYIDWGPGFRQQHDAALPDKARAALSFNLGPLALQYILENGGAGYFRTRVVQSYLDNGVMQRVPKAPEFSFPTYLVYSRARDSAVLQQALGLLREVVKAESDWSQRWDPLI